MSSEDLEKSRAIARAERIARLRARNTYIEEEYNALYKQGYRGEYIRTQLSLRYGLAEETIRKIITGEIAP